MKKGRQTFKGTPRTVLSALERTCERGAHAEGGSSPWTGLGWALLLLGGGGVSMGSWEAGGLGLAAGASCLWLGTGRSACAGDDARLDVATRWLEVMERELHPRKPFELTLDVGDPVQRRFLVSRKGDRARYRQPWLACTARLADKSSFRVRVERLVKVKERRGKSKTRVRELVTLRLKANPSLYPNRDQLMAFAGPPPGSFRLKGTRLKDGRLTVSVVTEEDASFTAEDLLLVFLWLYRGLRKAKASLLEAS